MGGSLHRKVADRTDDHGGWGAGRANPWYTSGRCGQPRAGQSVPALCVRSVDDTDTPGTSVVPVCGRWAGALPDRAGGTGRYGRASGPAGAMPPGDASDKDQDRLLKDGSRKGSYVNQGFDFLGYGFRPRLVKNSRRAACSGASRRRSARRPSPPCGRRYGRPTCATGPRSRWKTSPMRSIHSCGAGSSIMGATVPQRCIRCSAMSTGRWWHGPCGSTSAWRVTGRGPAPSLRPSQGRTRVSSHTGGKVLSARSPDGSRVRREPDARFCERPEGKLLRPTHHSFETTETELGLDHHESRSWHGWHRHVSLVMLAFAMLAIIRHHANQPDASQTSIRLTRSRRSRLSDGRSRRSAALPHVLRSGASGQPTSSPGRFGGALTRLSPGALI